MPLTNLLSKRVLTSFLFFISGFSGLIYQVLWTRQFKFLLGSSIVSISIIVAAFMSGLLIGSWWIGKKIAAKKTGKELKLYGYLEIIIGGYGLALLFLLRYTKSLFSILGEPSLHFNYLKLIFDVLLTLLFLVFPTGAMGATLPLLINYFTKKESDFRETISHFYAINALGGAIASLIAGFFLIRYLGVNGSICVAILLNVIIGLIALLTAKNDEDQTIQDEQEEATSSVKEPDNKFTQILLITSFLTGFIAIAYEVLWIRCLNYIVNNSTYTFSIILFVFLLGIALGSMLVSYLRKIANQTFVVAILQGLLSISGLLIIYLFYEFAYTETFSNWFLQTDSDTPIWYQTIGLNVSFSVLVFLLPSIFMGMTFPLLSDLYYKNKRLGSGEAISKIYVVNTLGSILGALIPVFIFIPLFGSIKSTLYLLAGLNLFMALYFLYRSNSSKKIMAIIGTAGCFAVLIFSAKSNNVLASLENVVEDSNKDIPIFYKEGVMATVKVYNQEKKYKALSINGVTIASESFKTKERTIGHLPFFTNRKINEVLAVGLASGSTVGAILQHEEVEHLDVVEIVPSVLDAVDYFKDINQDVKNNDRVDIYVDDILSHLSNSDKKYDLISSDGKFSFLNRANTIMLSQDYYKTCKEHLNEDGVFIQWVTTKVPHEHLKTILATINSVFPYSEMYLIRKNLFIMSSLKPIELNKDKIMNSFADPVLSQDLFSSFIYSPTELSSFYIGPNRNISDDEEHINTLNYPVLEYGYTEEREKDIQSDRASYYKNLLFLQSKYNENKDYIINQSTNKNEAATDYELNERYLNSRISFLNAGFAISENNRKKALLLYQMVIDDNHPAHDNNVAIAAKNIGEHYLQQKNYPKAINYFNKATTKMNSYTTAFMLKGVAFYYNGNSEESKTNFVRTLQLDPNNVTANQFLKELGKTRQTSVGPTKR